MTGATESPLSTTEVLMRKRADQDFTTLWSPPPGLGQLAAVNQTFVGRRFIITGFIFFLIAGVLGLLIRAQLIVPDNDLLGPDAYNQVFTMHGTMMMFLFAVPILEGAAMYLLPPMIGARDLPYPRLSAFGYWCYLFGGILLFSSLPLGMAPDGGWFIYPPLTSAFFSPGMNIDFWLLGITFIEISAVSAAIELIVAIFKTRAPGMSIDRMPLFVWYILVTAFMILFGFPPLILGSILFELERAFDFPFFDATRGGDAILWQHLFWLFGHPEVYIILMPAAGIVSMVVPTFARTTVFGYNWLVGAAIAVGFVSFGLWVHHMYAVGIPQLSLAFFSAASALIAIPNGIQIFAWLATVWKGKPFFATPMLFFIGFVLIFVLGGFTGVMVAMVPFDLQVHDTQFVVAHFHYVLIGGMVFPLFAGIYYWLPLALGRMHSERLGKWNFWLMFIGFNLTFFPLHHTGLIGMSRRVYTYPAGLGLEWTNLLASIGAAVFAIGVLLLLVNIAWTMRRGDPVAADNPWGASTLEWIQIPSPPYNFRSIPRITSRDPLWDQPDLRRASREGELFLAVPHGNRRLTMGTTPAAANPEMAIDLPKPTFIPLVAGVCMAIFFVGFLTQYYGVAALGAALSVGAFLVWMWPEPPPRRLLEVPVGCGMRLPLSYGHHAAPGWMGLLLTLAADATLYASLVFSFLFLWGYAPQWPPQGVVLPEPGLASLAMLALVIAGSLTLAWAEAGIRRGNQPRLFLGLGLAAACGILFLVILAFSGAELGFPPDLHAFTALSWVLVGYSAFHVFTALLMVLLALWRARAGHFMPDRHVAVRIAGWFWHYTAATWAVSYVLIYLTPYWI